MPKKGFKVVTIRDAVNKKIDELAKKLEKSAPQIVEMAVDALMDSQEESQPDA